MEQINGGESPHYIDAEFEKKLHENKLHYLFPIGIQVAASFGMPSLMAMCGYFMALTQLQLEMEEFKANPELRAELEKVFTLSFRCALDRLDDVREHIRKNPADADQIILGAPTRHWDNFYGPDLRRTELQIVGPDGEKVLDTTSDDAV